MSILAQLISSVYSSSAPAPPPPGPTTTSVFDYTGAAQLYTVPLGVTSITTKMWGAAGGGVTSYINNSGGGGGYSASTLNVTPGETLLVYVAQGGAGSTSDRIASGGGGSSAITRSTTPLIIAAGGAGSAHTIGGAGGGLTGENGTGGTSPNGGGRGATQSSVGAGGDADRVDGSSGNGYNGGDGSNVNGFNGAASFGHGLGGRGGINFSDNGGGGGGGGWYGGGGGGNDSGGYGGGGGSSYVPVGGTTLGGSGGTPGNSSDPDRGTAGSGNVGAAGNSGKVIIVTPTDGPISDEYSNYVTLLLHGEGTNNGTTFIDNSLYARTPSEINYAVTSTTEKKFGVSSIYFPNSVINKLRYASSTDFNISGIDFTIEMWFYQTGGSNSLLCRRDTVGGGFTSGWVLTTSNIRANINGSWNDDQISWTGPALNTWNHIAWTVSGTTMSVYLNGTLVGTKTSVTSISDVNTVLDLGQSSNGGENVFIGYIDELRITKGIARYTANFTPPSNQFPDPIDQFSPSDSLLLHMNGSNGSTSFIDSTYQSFFTVSGNAQISTAQSKFGSSSGLFDGTGDWITTDNTSLFDLSSSTVNFTIEMWVYNTGAGDYRGIIGARGNGQSAGWCLYIHQNNTFYMGSIITSGQSYLDRQLNTTVIPGNTWTHLALVKDSAGYTGYVNGVAGTKILATGGLDYQSAQRLIVGALGSAGEYPFTGYIDEVRITKGVARYTANFVPQTAPFANPPSPPAAPTSSYADYVTLLLPMSGTNGSTTFTDRSTNNMTITPAGNTQISTAQNPYGLTTGSVYFDGSSDYITAVNSSTINLQGNFTIETWFYPVARLNTSPAVWSNYNNYDGASLALFADGSANTTKYQLAVTNIGFPRIQSTASIIYNSWQHLAVVRNGSTITLYINGVPNGTTTSSANLSYGSTFWIGTSGDNLSSSAVNGYLSDFRIVSGVAVYTSRFIPSDAPLSTPIDPNYANVSLLLHLNGTNGSTTFIDSSTNNFAVTVNGNTQISTSVSKFGGSSVYFDGTGDYLEIANNSAFNFDTDNFTIEFWLYIPTGSATEKGILSKGQWPSSGGASFTFYYGQSGEITFYYSTTPSSSFTGNVRFTDNAPTNTWMHLALSRNGTSIRTFLNGILANTLVTSDPLQLNTDPVTIGSGRNGAGAFNGYIDELRITKGIARYTANFTPSTAPFPGGDPYYNNVTLLLHMNGANGSTTFTDSSISPKTVTANGNAQISIAESKFGGGSAYFDGTGDYLTSLPGSNIFDIFSNDFTVEFFVYFSGATSNQCLVQIGYTDGNRANVTVVSGLIAVFSAAANSGAVRISATAPATNTWHHVAWVKSGTTTSLYVNGVSVGTPQTSVPYPANEIMSLSIGGDYINGGVNCLLGYIDELRITKGIARYTANFTPPDAPFPN